MMRNTGCVTSGDRCQQTSQRVSSRIINRLDTGALFGPMFTSRKKLIARSGKKGVDRFEYLQELVNEYYQSNSLESQEQVLANLANFAYDPLNYHYLRELKVIDVFIDGLRSRNPFVIEYSSKGLCNLANDPLNQEIILKSNGLIHLKELLDADYPEVVCSSITTLLFLITPTTTPDIITLDTVAKFQKLKDSSNSVIKNLATLFFQDYCQQFLSACQ